MRTEAFYCGMCNELLTQFYLAEPAANNCCITIRCQHCGVLNDVFIPVNVRGSYGKAETRIRVEH